MAWTYHVPGRTAVADVTTADTDGIPPSARTL
jgi:hypothetical protein